MSHWQRVLLPRACRKHNNSYPSQIHARFKQLEGIVIVAARDRGRGGLAILLHRPSDEPGPLIVGAMRSAQPPTCTRRNMMDTVAPNVVGLSSMSAIHSISHVTSRRQCGARGDIIRLISSRGWAGYRGWGRCERTSGAIPAHS